MNSMGMIALRLGKSGKKEWQAEQIYGGLFSPGPDPAELRVWVADETELGKRVADDFVSTGRCPSGTLDQHFFAVQLRKSPGPGDAPKRRAGLGKARLCQDHRITAAGRRRSGRGPLRASGGYASQRPVLDGSRHVLPAGREGCGQPSGPHDAR